MIGILPSVCSGNQPDDWVEFYSGMD